MSNQVLEPTSPLASALSPGFAPKLGDSDRGEAPEFSAFRVTIEPRHPASLGVVSRRHATSAGRPIRVGSEPPLVDPNYRPLTDPDPEPPKPDDAPFFEDPTPPDYVDEPPNQPQGLHSVRVR
jgi:hypothetical protein